MIPQDHTRRAQFQGWLRLWLPPKTELSVAWTENRRTYLSYRRRGDALALRLHAAFAQAGPLVAHGVARYALGKKDGAAALRAFARGLARDPPAERAVRLTPVGRVHDLTALGQAVNLAHFSGRCTASLTWGRAQPPSRRRRGLTLGSYCAARNLIRIHPALDQAFVPSFVVAGVLHHEYLHEVVGVPEGPGRRRLHPPEFVALEALYPDHARCRAWEAANIARLLAYRP